MLFGIINPFALGIAELPPHQGAGLYVNVRTGLKRIRCFPVHYQSLCSVLVLVAPFRILPVSIHTYIHTYLQANIHTIHPSHLMTWHYTTLHYVTLHISIFIYTGHIYIYIYIYIVYVYVNFHAYTHVLYSCTCTYACKSVCVYACIHVCMYYICMYVCMYVRMYVCTYVCMYVCMYVRVCI